MQAPPDRRITSAHVIAMLALFLALGGGAFAIKAASKNSVVSKSVKDNSLRGRDVKAATLTGSDVAADSLGGADIDEASLAIQAPAAPLQSGQTLRGTWALLEKGAGAAWTGVSFQAPAPEPVDSRHVVMLGAGGDDVPGSGCTGSASNPTAAPGFVCVYSTVAAGPVTGRFGWGAACSCADPTTTGDGSRFGFLIQIQGTSAPGDPALVGAGVWAYTAP